ncbi:MAG: DNA-binding protein [SAR324 cluster bacterium]|nr:DNA-binding protein [SAR324 cluster bacterium]
MVNSCLDTSAAAKYCCVSKALLEKLRCYGGGPVFCRLGLGRGRIVYRVADLDDWLRSNRRRSTSDRVGLEQADDPGDA